MQRSYCLTFVLTDRIYLVASWPFLVKYGRKHKCLAPVQYLPLITRMLHVYSELPQHFPNNRHDGAVPSRADV